MLYDELFELVLENTLEMDPDSDGFLMEESFKDRKAAKAAYKNVQQSAQDYRSAKDDYFNARRNGSSSDAKDAKNRLDNARRKAQDDIKTYRSLKPKKNDPLASLKKNIQKAGKSAKETLVGGQPYEQAKKKASDFANSFAAQDVFSKKKELDNDAYEKSGILNKAVSKVKAKGSFLKGAAAGAGAGAITTGIVKALGVSLLSIAAIRAAGGVKNAGRGVMLSGKAKHELASAQARELKANAKLTKAETKAAYANIDENKKRLEMDVKAREKEEARQKIYADKADQLEKEVKRIEDEMKEVLAQFNQGKISEPAMKKKLNELMKKAKDLVDKSKRAQQGAEKGVTESVEFECEFVEQVFGYQGSCILESVDFEDVIESFTED